jgi:predicted DNA-binding transcriptional regulator AlpA
MRPHPEDCQMHAKTIRNEEEPESVRDLPLAHGRRNEPDRPLLNIEMAASRIGVSRASLYRAIRRGDAPVPIVTCNGRYWVPSRAIERILDGDVLHSGSYDPSRRPLSSDSAAARA